MNRRSIFTFSAITSLGLIFSLSGAIAQTKSLKDQLVGTWTVSSWEQDVKNGPKLQRFGASPKGINIFEANGRFAIMYMRPDLPKVASNDPGTPTPDEAKALATGSIAYYGTYTVDEASKILNLHIESSTFPNQLGIDQKRTVTSLTADELKHTNTSVVGGNGQIYITLKRAN
jgi:Lipocalin-like domain